MKNLSHIADLPAPDRRVRGAAVGDAASFRARSATMAAGIGGVAAT